MVSVEMSTPPGRTTPPGVIVTHPNRGKSVVQATRATVVLLLLVSVALMLIVTIGGWGTLEGDLPILFGYILVYVVMAYFTSRWSRGVLPMAAALGLILSVFALVAAPAWFQRDKAGFAAPHLNASLLGIVTLAIIPVQILLIAFAMRGFSQGWNVELEQLDPKADRGALAGSV
jgi:hypothetical protein